MEDRRQSQRRKVLKGGRVVLANSATRDCRIRDMSESGAKLEFSVFTALPSEFSLIVADECIPVRTAWQTGLTAGVAIKPNERRAQIVAALMGERAELESRVAEERAPPRSARTPLDGRTGAGDLAGRTVSGEVTHINELILEFLAEIHQDFPTLRQMSDQELGRLFREWLQKRHPDRFPTIQ